MYGLGVRGAVWPVLVVVLFPVVPVPLEFECLGLEFSAFVGTIVTTDCCRYVEEDPQESKNHPTEFSVTKVC